MRTLTALLTCLLPWLVWAQEVPEPVPGPISPGSMGLGWLWGLVLAVAFVALVTWALVRGRHRGGPPVAR